MGVGFCSQVAGVFFSKGSSNPASPHDMFGQIHNRIYHKMLNVSPYKVLLQYYYPRLEVGDTPPPPPPTTTTTNHPVWGPLSWI